MRVVLAVLSILSLYGCQPVYAQVQGEAVRAYFKQAFGDAVSLTTDEVNYASKKVNLGHPDYHIIQEALPDRQRPRRVCRRRIY